MLCTPQTNLYPEAEFQVQLPPRPWQRASCMVVGNDARARAGVPCPHLLLLVVRIFACRIVCLDDVALKHQNVRAKFVFVLLPETSLVLILPSLNILGRAGFEKHWLFNGFQ